MRPISDYDNLVTYRMVEFTELAPENLRGKRIPMMCEDYGMIKFSDLVDLTNGTTLFRSEKKLVNPSPDTYDYNQLIEMAVIVPWFPYTEIEMILIPENIEESKQDLDNGERYFISTKGILTAEDGRDLFDLTEDEQMTTMVCDMKLNADKVVEWFEKHNAPITKEAVLHNFDAWQEDKKCGFLDEVNGYHLFSPCCCNPLTFRRSTLHPSCKDWQVTHVNFEGY